MKKKLFASAVIVIGLSLCVGSTWAYFTAEKTAHNVITSGGIGIEIIEKTKDSQGTELEFPQEGMKNIMPGSKISKIVSVLNSGEGTAWIRIKAEPFIVSENGEELPLKLEAEEGTVPVMAFTAGQDWVDGEDGFYYYEKPVAPGGKTTVFFDEVSFSLQMGNAYQNSTASLTILAQAVQTANNPIPANGDVTDIPGWPSEE